jgi:hypothetical protein
MGRGKRARSPAMTMEGSMSSLITKAAAAMVAAVLAGAWLRWAIRPVALAYWAGKQAGRAAGRGGAR